MEKSDVENLPEGMSSEELDALTTESEGTEQEALEATQDDAPGADDHESEETTEEPAEKPDKEVKDKPVEEKAVEKPVEEKPAEEKPEVDPKDAVIGDFRRRLRDQELEAARLKGELEARKDLQKPTPELPKSPLDIAEAAYIEENGTNDGFTITPELYRQQEAFRDNQIATKAATERHTQSTTALQRAAVALQAGELSAEKMGEGLDYKSVARFADKYLTKGDTVDLAEIQGQRGTTAALKEAYQIIVRRTLAAGGEDAKALQNAINAKAKPKPKPKKEPTDIDALTTEGDDANTGEPEEGPNKRLTDFIFAE